MNPDAMLSLLRPWVDHDSPSRDKAALDAMARLVGDRFRALGHHVETLANPEGGDHLLIRCDFPAASPSQRPALVLGHFDTVWPAGTAATRPFRVEGDRAFGPGVYDMKASLAIVLEALAHPGQPTRPIHVLLTSDEEIGSPTSRPLIEERAKQSEYVLVVEPPLPDGSLKTARKGVGGYTVEVMGRSAHAGVEPEKGVNAIVELAHQVLKIHALADPSAGTTVGAGTICGGTTPNVVPASASARFDVRASTLVEARRIEAAFSGLRPVNTEAKLAVIGGFNRPPMERTEGVAGLFHRAREIGRTLGMELTEGSTGGGSDGNFTAALGVPTLDGLGAMGAGAHAEDEHVLISSLGERAALLAALLAGL